MDVPGSWRWSHRTFATLSQSSFDSSFKVLRTCVGMVEGDVELKGALSCNNTFCLFFFAAFCFARGPGIVLIASSLCKE